MKSLFTKLIVVFLAVFFSNPLVAQGLSFKSLNTCSNDYSVIMNTEAVTSSVDELPPGVYLARSVTQVLEKSEQKYYSYQTLLEGYQASPELCYKGLPTSAIKTQAFIPTVIDRTTRHTWGNTFWSLSAVLNKLTGAIHSKRSLIPNHNYREALITQGYKVASFQKTHNEFQIRLERNISSWKETILITYDQF